MTCAATTTGYALRQSPSRRSHAAALYQIGPFKVSFRSDLDEIMEDVEHLYRHCRLSPMEGDSTCDVIEMEVRRHLFSLPFHRRYVIYGDGQPLFSPRRRDEVLPYLEWGVNWRIIESRREHLQLHAATVSWRGQGVILAANSGSGKSTLTAGMLTRGWKYFSDEFALIDPQTRMLHAYPKALCMKAGSFDAVRSLGLPLYTRRHYVKAFKGRVAYISLADLSADVVSPPLPGALRDLSALHGHFHANDHAHEPRRSGDGNGHDVVQSSQARLRGHRRDRTGVARRPMLQARIG